jgi:hypothetical protein
VHVFDLPEQGPSVPPQTTYCAKAAKDQGDALICALCTAFVSAFQLIGVYLVGGHG